MQAEAADVVKALRCSFIALLFFEFKKYFKALL
jgi:hypothetical protein